MQPPRTPPRPVAARVRSPNWDGATRSATTPRAGETPRAALAAARGSRSPPGSDLALEHAHPYAVDGAVRIEPLRADFGAIHDRPAAEQAVDVVQVLQAFGAGVVAVVRDEAHRLEERRRTEVTVGVPPIRRTEPGAARAQDALVESVELGAVGGGLQALALGRRLVVDDVRSDRMVMVEEARHVDHEIADHGEAWQRAQRHRLLQRVERRDAGESVAPVDVHRIRSARPLAARATKSETVVLLAQAYERVEQHPVAMARGELVGLHARPGIGLRVVAVDQEAHRRLPPKR